MKPSRLQLADWHMPAILAVCLQDFRCFVSAEPIAGAPHARIVPEGLLQSCIKVSNEPPSDIRSNMRAAWGAFSAGGQGRGWDSPLGGTRSRAPNGTSNRPNPAPLVPPEFFERPSTEAKRRALRSIIFGLCFCELHCHQCLWQQLRLRAMSAWLHVRPAATNLLAHHHALDALPCSPLCSAGTQEVR